MKISPSSSSGGWEWKWIDFGWNPLKKIWFHVPGRLGVNMYRFLTHVLSKSIDFERRVGLGAGRIINSCFPELQRRRCLRNSSSRAGSPSKTRGHLVFQNYIREDAFAIVVRVSGSFGDFRDGFGRPSSPIWSKWSISCPQAVPRGGPPFLALL